MTSPIGRRRPLNRRRATGFTLVEMMLVTIVLSVIIALSVPAFRGTFRHVQLENLSLDLAKLMRYARERAIVERRSVRFHLDPHRKRYWLEVEDTSESDEEPFRPAEDRLGGVHLISEDVTIEVSAESVTFYPDGRADAFTITLTAGPGSTYTLITREATGHVKLFKHDQG